MEKPVANRIYMNKGYSSFTFGPKTKPSLPDPEDYDVDYNVSWKTKTNLKKIPNQGFVIYFDSPCPTDHEYIDLIITDKMGNWLHPISADNA